MIAAVKRANFAFEEYRWRLARARGQDWEAALCTRTRNMLRKMKHHRFDGAAFQTLRLGYTYREHK